MTNDQSNTVQSEIAALEERLRQAELSTDPAFYEEFLDEQMIVVAEDGTSQLAKARVVQAHQPGNGPKFTKVEMRDLQIIDHGSTAIVTCKGTYQHAKGVVSLSFLRVWVKKNGNWRIVAGTVSKV